MNQVGSWRVRLVSQKPQPAWPVLIRESVGRPGGVRFQSALVVGPLIGERQEDISDHSVSLEVLDISSPTNIISLGQLQSEGHLVEGPIRISGSHAVCAGFHGGIQLLEVSNPSNITITSVSETRPIPPVCASPPSLIPLPAIGASMPLITMSSSPMIWMVCRSLT